MMEIRTATGEDRDDVRGVHLAAFPEGEREIVSNLAVALLAGETIPRVVNLVAEVSGAIVGHVAFSPVTLQGDESFLGYILAPLAVRPGHQERGTGAQLVKCGLERLFAMGVKMVFVYGDPKYYGRFGFRRDAAEPYEPPYRLQYPFGWQAMVLDETMMEETSGRISCVAPLCDPTLW